MKRPVARIIADVTEVDAISERRAPKAFAPTDATSVGTATTSRFDATSRSTDTVMSGLR